MSDAPSPAPASTSTAPVDPVALRDALENEPIVVTTPDPEAVPEDKETPPDTVPPEPPEASKKVEWERRREEVRVKTLAQVANKYEFLQDEIKRGTITLEQVHGLWSTLEAALAHLCPKLSLDESKPVGARLCKKGDWTSVSLEGHLLDPYKDDPHMSLWGVIIITAILKRGGTLVDDFIEIIGTPPHELELDIEWLAAGQPSMSTTNDGGIYVLFSKACGHYVGLSIHLKKRRAGHTAHAVNHKFRECGEQRAKWRDAVIFTFEDDDTSPIEYSLETFVNLMTKATINGLNCNYFDRAHWLTIATVAEMREVWVRVCVLLEAHLDWKILAPNTTSIEARSLWAALDPLPLARVSIDRFLHGVMRPHLLQKLFNERPLRLSAWTVVPTVLLDDEERKRKHEVAKPSAHFHAGLKIGDDGKVFHADMPASKVPAQKAGIAAATAIDEERRREADGLEGTEAEMTMKEAAMRSEEQRKRMWAGKPPKEEGSDDKRTFKGKKSKFIEIE
ncbi:hypothetical protein JCM8208_000438 [Rhodotorula glutinis]